MIHLNAIKSLFDFTFEIYLFNVPGCNMNILKRVLKKGIAGRYLLLEFSLAMMLIILLLLLILL